MTVPAILSLSVPSADERALIEQMSTSLELYNAENVTAESYYDGSHVADAFGISTPPSMQNLRAVAGWPGTCVDVLEERLDWLGWSSDGDPFGLAQVYAQNGLDVDSGMAHLDALIFGVSFVTVGTGYDGEPNPLVTPHSPKSMTTLWDARARRASAALSVLNDADGQPTERTLYLPNETVRVAYSSGRWAVVDRDQHNLGRLPVVPVAVDSGPLYHRLWKRPGTITLHFGEPIEPGLPREEIEARVHAAINALNEA